MRNFREFILLLGIPMGRTLGRSGIRLLILMWWGGSLIFGWTGQLVESRDYRAKSEAAIPAEFKVPNESPHPMFVQVDFGLVREPGGALRPMLVELQAFPSLYAYQPVLAQSYMDVFGLDGGLKYFLGGLDESSYRELMRRAVIGNVNRENVILMEIDPLHQKTLPDFLLT